MSETNPINEEAAQAAVDEAHPDPAEVIAAAMNGMSQRLDALEEQMALVFGLMRSHAESQGDRLKNRQVDGGLQFFWEKEGGRIIVP